MSAPRPPERAVPDACDPPHPYPVLTVEAWRFADATWLIINEMSAPIQLVGGALIVMGVALVRMDELRVVEPQPQVNPAEPALAVVER